MTKFFGVLVALAMVACGAIALYITFGGVLEQIAAFTF